MKPKTKKTAVIAIVAACAVGLAWLVWWIVNSKKKNNGLIVIGTSVNTENTNDMSANENQPQNHFGNTSLPRGYRNNNPLNVRKNALNAWKGKVVPGTDPAFEQFATMAYGYRCGLYLVRKYIGQGHNTIRKIINKWAPPSENNTGGYINNVVSRTGISADTVLSRDDRDSLCRIVRAMAWSENGYPPATMDDIYQGWSLL